MNLELGEINIKNSSAAEFNNNYKVLTLQDREEWWAYLKRLPALMQDAYYTPEYYELYEKNGDGTGLALFMKIELVWHYTLFYFPA